MRRCEPKPAPRSSSEPGRTRQSTRGPPAEATSPASARAPTRKTLRTTACPDRERTMTRPRAPAGIVTGTRKRPRAPTRTRGDRRPATLTPTRRPGANPAPLTTVADPAGPTAGTSAARGGAAAADAGATSAIASTASETSRPRPFLSASGGLAVALRLIRRVPWTLIVFPLLAAPADAAKGVATVFAHPAAGPSGTHVGLTGSRFGRNALVKLSVAGRRSVSVRAGARGGFRRTVTIPATTTKRVKVVIRRGKRRVVVYLYLSPRAGGSEAGTARGARVRWSPRRGVAGTTVRVHGIALKRRAPMTAGLGPA